MNKLVTALLILTLLGSIFLGGCGSKTASTGNLKALKVGYLGDMSWPATVDAIHNMDVYKDLYDKKGGLVIGGEKYTIDFILYDTKGDQATSMAALNKLIFEDKVKFILSDFTPLADAWVPVTEANKVIYSCQGVSPALFSPKNRYTFETGGLPSAAVCAPAWYAKNNPNVKTALLASPDTQMGHMGAADVTAIMATFGVKVDPIFYPANQSDLSSLGTQVAKINPPLVLCQGGGPVVDSLAQKAIYNAGWRGPFFTAPPSTYIQMANVTPPEVLEGQVISAEPGEFDPPSIPAAKEFKDAFIAKIGKWSGERLGMATWEAVLAACQKAGTVTDTDKIADIMGSGLKYSGVAGDYEMVSRMDWGNSRTCCVAQQLYMKKIVNGKPSLIGTWSVDEVKGVLNSYFVKK
jgi:branched-chain amino acid transport system substrate-binding protein